jgi:acyl-CoA reductase-like NAD-dependent aldehyde dehydrogenase
LSISLYHEVLEAATLAAVNPPATVLDFNEGDSERIQAGVVKINQISTGLALQAPFGGVKKSSTDSFKEQGAGAIDFYTRIKTVYLDYSA